LVISTAFTSATDFVIIVAFAGLTYLSLFLTAKLSATLPLLLSSRDLYSSRKDVEERKAAAAPPLHLLVIVFIPIATAIYIASTQFTDHKHAGWLRCLVWFLGRYNIRVFCVSALSPPNSSWCWMGVGPLASEHSIWNWSGRWKLRYLRTFQGQTWSRIRC
jgi:hypothetical protein